MPVVTIIAGPNGAGKTTFAKRLVEQTEWRGVTFLNVDEIAKALSSSGARAQIDVLAGRVFLDALKRKIDERSDVILETTLARLGLAQDIPRWRATGYRVDLYYLRLPDADTAVASNARKQPRTWDT